jgi:6-pyruvoyltetrahydropterin/6-carboxytetrahydropterin synthase
LILLNRLIRFCAVDPATLDQSLEADTNGFGGRPAMVGLGTYYELKIVCRGEPDPVLQYVVDIKDIDAAARQTIIPAICKAAWTHPQPPIHSILAASLPALNEALAGRLHSLELRLTPTYAIEMNTQNPRRVLLRQRFDFAAAHRLHSPQLSDEQNRLRYGKCNNPNGHGHNYQFEPCVAVDVTESGFGALSLADLEVAAKQTIIDRFDHTHLNEDTVEFNPSRGGLIPTVENISKVLFHMLDAALRARWTGATLVSMTVWETDRTSATYPG